jgi:manganese/iron transport system permease protein
LIPDLVLEPLGYPIFIRALVAAILVGTVCASVGAYVVLRGLAFIGDAIGHAAFPGVVIAYLLQAPFYLGAVIAAIATALGIGLVTRHTRLRSDTAIGVLFAGAFALGIFLFSAIEGYVADLFSFLVGNILFIGLGDLIALLAIGGLVLLTIAILWKELLYATFDPLGASASGLPVARLEYLLLVLVALTVVVSVQAVGIVLVVAMLVTPAAAAQLLARRFGTMMALAVAFGSIGSVIGLYLSYWLDAASGASIVLVQTVIFLGALAASSLRRRSSPRLAGGSAS